MANSGNNRGSERENRGAPDMNENTGRTSGKSRKQAQPERQNSSNKRENNTGTGSRSNSSRETGNSRGRNSDE